MKHIITIFIIAFLVSGCAGTAITRQNNFGGHVVGGYPFKAIVYDVSEMGLLGYVSLPVDFVVDVVGFPFDMVAWCFGYVRPYPPYEYK